jgi:hypothetical protein
MRNVSNRAANLGKRSPEMSVAYAFFWPRLLHYRFRHSGSPDRTNAYLTPKWYAMRLHAC